MTKNHSDNPANRPERSPDPAISFVAVYLVHLCYGGPEEGGWWYESGELVTDPAIYEAVQSMPRTFTDEEAARTNRTQMQERLDSTVNVGRRPISSMLSNGQYQARIYPTEPPPVFPAAVPHYE